MTLSALGAKLRHFLPKTASGSLAKSIGSFCAPLGLVHGLLLLKTVFYSTKMKDYINH